MERRLHNDELEDLLQEKADQFRMYPSDKVWKEINKTIHPRKKWYWLGVALLLTGVGYHYAEQFISPSPIASYTPPAKSSGETDASRPAATQPAQLVPFSSDVKVSRKQPPTVPPVNTLNAFAASPLTTSIDGEATEAKVIPIDALSVSRDNEAVESSEIPQHVDIESLLAAVDRLPELAPAATASKEEKDDNPRINWLEEQAVYELHIPKTKRWSFQINGSPTMNYRKLAGDRTANLQSSIKNIPFALSVPGDVSKLVNHKPAVGFEVGGSVLYALGKNFSLKAGLQFNFSRYYIEAYKTSNEIATIALTDSYGFRSDSISNLSTFRNFGGYAANPLQNQYFQLSAPVGAEWKVIGNGRLQLNVAATIQPTYLLNKNSYMITTDMKNYTIAPSLVRRWNINTAAEAFVSYKAAGLRWQVGPQFRYQLLSSYSSKYPIKEFLMEYGVKFGITKTIR